MVGTTANGTRPGTHKKANGTAVGADDTGPGGATDNKAKSTAHHRKRGRPLRRQRHVEPGDQQVSRVYCFSQTSCASIIAFCPLPLKRAVQFIVLPPAEKTHLSVPLEPSGPFQVSWKPVVS